MRTTILALAAVVLALLGRVPRLREAGWLVYPTLAVGGLKFFLDDLPNGRAGTLFVSLLVLGGALLLVSRLGAAISGVPGDPGVPTCRRLDRTSADPNPLLRGFFCPERLRNGPFGPIGSKNCLHGG